MEENEASKIIVFSNLVNWRNGCQKLFENEASLACQC